MIVVPGPEPVLQRTWYLEGEAARHAGVSTRTLRRWSTTGLLQPVKMDGQNHYRWVDVAQVAAEQESKRTRDYTGGIQMGHHGRTPRTVLTAPGRTVTPACPVSGCKQTPGHAGDHDQKTHEVRRQRREG